jgi:Ca2+-binding RTX toxin-like protein
MTGGAGNDTYVVDNAGDMVREMADGGTDTVESSLSWTLGAEVEKLTLTGTEGINATGNDLDNRLRGNAGNNRMDGGLGNDRMIGGAGDDTYVVESAGDTTVESASGGTDTVQSSITWRLGGNVENLTLSGSDAIDGTGNALDNLLRGNAANNTLIGGRGADTMLGGEGDDTYAGGAGDDTFTDTSATSNDTYLWRTGAGLDTLTDSGGGLDHVDLFAGITAAQLKFTRNADNLELSIVGNAADKLTINGWYTSSSHQIEEFRLSDGSAVLAGQVNSLVSAMASFGGSASTALAGPAPGVMQLRPAVELAMPWAA